MRVAVTGAGGLLGSAVLHALHARGDEALRLVRRAAAAPSEVQWDPEGGRIDDAALRGIDAAVHLAGESIAARRWTARQKHRIRMSRVRGTTLLARTLAGLEPTPAVLVCASATGYYGDRGGQTLTEGSPSGQGFLPQVVIEWEAASQHAADAGIRVVNLRFGVILSPRGGILARMLPLFRAGLGATLGSGRQFLPWIALDDAAAAVAFALTNPALRGPVNAVAPDPTTNARFTAVLARAVRRRSVLRIPGPAVRLLFGQMGDELLLASTLAVPELLQSAGYRFRHPHLDSALADALADC